MKEFEYRRIFHYLYDINENNFAWEKENIFKEKIFLVRIAYLVLKFIKSYRL